MSQALAGNERASAVYSRQGFCDPHHKASVEHDAEHRRTLGDDGLLHGAKRYEKEAGAVLESSEPARELNGLVDCCVVKERKGVEVDELARTITDNFFRLFTKAKRPA